MPHPKAFAFLGAQPAEEDLEWSGDHDNVVVAVPEDTALLKSIYPLGACNAWDVIRLKISLIFRDSINWEINYRLFKFYIQ